MLTTGFPRSGGDFSGVFVFQLARELVRAGIEVRAVCPHAPGLPVTEKMDGVEVRRFRYAFPSSLEKLAYGGGIPTNLRRSLLARLEVPFFTAAMAAAAARWGRRADLVHAQWAVSGFAASLARPLCSRPLVLTVRGSDLKAAGGGLTRWATGRALRSAARVLAVSEDLRSEAVARGAPEEKVRMLPNGVDLDAFAASDRAEARERLGLSRDAAMVLFAGQLAPVKNPLALAAAAGGLAKLEPRVEFHVVGEGPEEEALRARAGELGVSDRVVLHGRRPHREMPAWLAACDMLILPSRSEGRPNVVLEAMAASRPVVASNVGGVSELVDDGRTGILVPAEDDAALTEALRKLLADPASRERMGAAGRARIEELGLSWKAQAAEHIRLYEEVISGG
jgi:glycosyltransferase involved in cell wall biosynthesis